MSPEVPNIHVTAEDYRSGKMLHDPEQARKFLGTRLRPNTRIEDLLLTAADFAEAQRFFEKEQKIVFEGKDHITEERALRGIIYAITTAALDYRRQLMVLGTLDALGVHNADDINKHPEKVFSAFIQGGTQTKKTEAVVHLAQNGRLQDITRRVNDIYGMNKDDERALRDYVVKEVKGLKEKTASLFLRMCGTQHLIPMDTWMIRTLSEHGYPFKARYDSKVRHDEGGRVVSTIRGLTKPAHLEGEDWTEDLASKYGVQGHFLQLAYWTRRSAYQQVRAVQDQRMLFDIEPDYLALARNPEDIIPRRQKPESTHNTEQLELDV